MRTIKRGWVFFVAVVLCAVSLYAAEPELDGRDAAASSGQSGSVGWDSLILAANYLPGESRSIALTNSFFVGGTFLDSAPGSEIVFFSAIAINSPVLRAAVTVTCPNGFTFTNFVDGAFIPDGQVIEGTPPYPGTPDPDNGMYVLSGGNLGLIVRNPVFGDTQWRVTLTNNADEWESFGVRVAQRIREIGNEVHGQGWRFVPETGTITVSLSTNVGWRWNFPNFAGHYFAIEDVRHVVFGENITFIGQNHFRDCINLQSVTFKNPTPLSNLAGVFANTNTPNLTTIYVPPGTKAAFAEALYPAPFNIVELREDFNVPPTGVPDIAVAMAAMLVLFAVSAASWGELFFRKKSSPPKVL